jgi:hypothetical protein
MYVMSLKALLMLVLMLLLMLMLVLVLVLLLLLLLLLVLVLVLLFNMELFFVTMVTFPLVLVREVRRLSVVMLGVYLFYNSLCCYPW